MIVRKATQLGNPVIRTKAKPVSPNTKVTKKVITDLIDSMRHHGLVGMAAPQIGTSLRIFVTEIRKTQYRNKEQSEKLRVFINPRITSFSKKTIKAWEGCGSVASANLFGMTRRPTSIRIVAQDQNGEKFELEAKGLLAQVIQHEMDHLNGRVFTDHADPKTYMSRPEYLKMKGRRR